VPVARPVVVEARPRTRWKAVVAHISFLSLAPHPVKRSEETVSAVVSTHIQGRPLLRVE
jgi:hypothetical protein